MATGLPWQRRRRRRCSCQQYRYVTRQHNHGSRLRGQQGTQATWATKRGRYLLTAVDLAQAWCVGCPALQRVQWALQRLSCWRCLDSSPSLAPCLERDTAVDGRLLVALESRAPTQRVDQPTHQDGNRTDLLTDVDGTGVTLKCLHGRSTTLRSLPYGVKRQYVAFQAALIRRLCSVDLEDSAVNLQTIAICISPSDEASTASATRSSTQQLPYWMQRRHSRLEWWGLQPIFYTADAIAVVNEQHKCTDERLTDRFSQLSLCRKIKQKITPKKTKMKWENICIRTCESSTVGIGQFITYQYTVKCKLMLQKM